jgi:hypothetical protein
MNMAEKQIFSASLNHSVSESRHAITIFSERTSAFSLTYQNQRCEISIGHGDNRCRAASPLHNNASLPLQYAQHQASQHSTVNVASLRSASSVAYRAIARLIKTKMVE